MADSEDEETPPERDVKVLFKIISLLSRRVDVQSIVRDSTPHNIAVVHVPLMILLLSLSNLLLA